VNDFKTACLGSAGSGNLKENVEYILTSFGEHFLHSLVDRRLVGASCRDPQIQGKRFSQIAAENEASLKDSSVVELASRIATLLCLHKLAEGGAAQG
jgi:hypothetical protein